MPPEQKIETDGIDDSFAYVFPAIRGVQASKEYYVTMCPLKLIPKIFIYNESGLPPKLRAQRTLNKARIPEISNYIITNPKDYIFSSLTVSVDGDIKFTPLHESIKKSKLGLISIPMDARFIINDGQHRRAAIEAALEKKPELGLETISVVIFIDEGLKKSQQMFSDLNHHAVRPTRSLGILYDNRNPFSRMILDIINAVPIFSTLTELERTNISNRSTKLFTLSGVHKATKELLGKHAKNPTVTESEMQLAIEFWNEVLQNMPQWNQLLDGETTSYDLRQNQVNAHGVVLDALGIVGRALIKEWPTQWKKKLCGLRKINWARTNAKIWEGRALVGGRLSKTQSSVTLTANYIKSRLGVHLSQEELKLEKMLEKSYK
jgi:DNA sulfur modification protein DndB